MPNVDGLQAATQLAADGLRRPVVVVTGVDDPTLIERSIVSGVSAYLTKPVDTRELEAALALATARHAEFEAPEAEVDQARQALEDRKLVERAKGLDVRARSVRAGCVSPATADSAQRPTSPTWRVASSSSRACSSRRKQRAARTPRRPLCGHTTFERCVRDDAARGHGVSSEFHRRKAKAMASYRSNK
jgi:response regulator RpfG family c-di-GMP phosphodiesterase